MQDYERKFKDKKHGTRTLKNVATSTHLIQHNKANQKNFMEQL